MHPCWIVLAPDVMKHEVLLTVTAVVSVVQKPTIGKGKAWKS